MNIIMGLPRSGSTLLCNILAQNPAFQVEHTNALSGLLMQLVNIWSSDADIKGGLADRREETEARLIRCAKGLCENWHNTDKLVFNKSRGWAHNLLLLNQIYPEAKVIVTIRDLREVFASFEKQHRKFPLLEQGIRPLTQRAQHIFSQKGMIGGPLMGIEDILRRKQDVFFVKYEDFVRYPEQMLEKLYCFIDQPSFNHDYENVVNTATDPDYLYLNKYPHEGSGKVEARPPSWPKLMDEAISNGIVNGFPWFFKEFKYIKPKKQQQQPDNGQQPLKRLKHVDAR